MRTARRLRRNLVAWLSAWLDYCPGAALWDHEPTKRSLRGTATKQLVIPSREAQMLAKAAGESQSGLVIGANERVDEGPGNGRSTILLTFGFGWRLAQSPSQTHSTYTERIVWGQGDGGGLKALIHQWPHRRTDLLGALDALARQVLHDSGDTYTSRCGPQSTKNCTRSLVGIMRLKEMFRAGGRSL